MSEHLGPADVAALDNTLRLYTRSQLAELVGCHVNTVAKALADPESPLHYTHQRGKRGLIDHATAQAWIDTWRIPEGE